MMSKINIFSFWHSKYIVPIIWKFPSNTMITFYIQKLIFSGSNLYKCEVEVYILSSVCQGLTVMENLAISWKFLIVFYVSFVFSGLQITFLK